ncbi:MAG TPA: hypothetical protein VD861_14240, partial [Pyrinomonadaceae bacterium]|nr:hypothetical protein [Pyrinomonadaceae bacterium]
MDREEILRRKAEIEERYGQWVSHSIKLADGIYTTPPEAQRRKLDSVRRFIQIISDVTNAPLEGLRVLDLACLEGIYAVEFALRGARVVGIEGRRRNIEKARFV